MIDSASLFTRYPGNPVLSPERWPYRVNAVMNAGARRASTTRSCSSAASRTVAASRTSRAPARGTARRTGSSTRGPSLAYDGNAPRRSGAWRTRG